MKKIVTLGILMICLLVAVRMTTFANAESIEEVSFVDADDVVDEKNVERGDSGIIEDKVSIKVSVTLVNSEKLLHRCQDAFSCIHRCTPYLERAMYFLIQKPSTPSEVRTL